MAIFFHGTTGLVSRPRKPRHIHTPRIAANHNDNIACILVLGV